MALTVSNTLVRSLLFVAEMFEVAPQDALVETGLKLEQLRDIDGTVAEGDYDRVFANCARLVKDDHFGLHLGQKLTLQQLGVIGYLMMNAETFAAALGAYQRFQKSLGESIVLSWSTQGSVARITCESFGGELSGQHRIESFLAAIRAAGFELTGKELKLKSWGITYPARSNSAPYVEIMGSVPERSPQNFIEFPKEYLDLRIINSSPELTPIFEGQLQQKLLKASSFVREVRRELLKRIGKDKAISGEDIAQHFAMSERNFQLKLEKEDMSFRELLEEAQTDFARRFLRAGSPIAEIAYALGFSEPSAFQRAFKRWTGLTPGQARAPHT